MFLGLLLFLINERFFIIKPLKKHYIFASWYTYPPFPISKSVYSFCERSIRIFPLLTARRALMIYIHECKEVCDVMGGIIWPCTLGTRTCHRSFRRAFALIHHTPPVMNIHAPCTCKYWSGRNYKDNYSGNAFQLATQPLQLTFSLPSRGVINLI